MIANAPSSDLSMSNIMTGKGTDPIMATMHKTLQRKMMKSLTDQFPTIAARFRFFGLYLKNTLLTKQMSDSKRKLSSTIKGAAIEHNLIQNSIQGVIIAKSLTDMYGHERATKMLSKCQEDAAPIMNEPLLRYFEYKVPQHLRFAVSNGLNKKILNKSVEEDGIFEIEWIDDDIYSKEFGFNVKRCIFRDIGKEFGDTEEGGENNLTYKWFCTFDDKMIPALGDVADFKFERDGTLGKGCSHCDFRFKHQAKEEKPKPRDYDDKEDDENATLFD